MTITLKNEVAKDLIEFKLKSIKNTLNEILKKWNQENAEDFIEKARSGDLPNAEMDAITVRQIINDIDELDSLYKSIK